MSLYTQVPAKTHCPYMGCIPRDTNVVFRIRNSFLFSFHPKRNTISFKTLHTCGPNTGGTMWSLDIRKRELIPDLQYHRIIDLIRLQVISSGTCLNLYFFAVHTITYMCTVWTKWCCSAGDNCKMCVGSNCVNDLWSRLYQSNSNMAGKLDLLIQWNLSFHMPQ